MTKQELLLPYCMSYRDLDVQATNEDFVTLFKAVAAKNPNDFYHGVEVVINYATMENLTTILLVTLYFYDKALKGETIVLPVAVATPVDIKVKLNEFSTNILNDVVEYYNTNCMVDNTFKRLLPTLGDKSILFVVALGFVIVMQHHVALQNLQR